MTEQEKDFKTALTESIGMVAVDGSSSPIAMIDLMDAHLSDRDKFAIGFAEWILINKDLIRGELKDGKMVWWHENYFKSYPSENLLDLYKQSLTKTDKG